MTLSTNRIPAAQPTATGQLPPRPAARGAAVIEARFDSFADIQVATVGFNWQPRMGQRPQQGLPTAIRCLST